jgi:hypothetical protein
VKLKGVIKVSVASAAVLAILCSCSTTVPAEPVTVAPVTVAPAAMPVEAGDSRSYIVEAGTTDLAAQAVQAVGGRVVSRLGVIDAVEANLTHNQHARVLRTAGIKQVTVNATVMTQIEVTSTNRHAAESWNKRGAGTNPTKRINPMTALKAEVQARVVMMAGKIFSVLWLKY